MTEKTYNQKILDKLDEYGLRSTDSLDILDICRVHIESEKKKIKVSATKGFAEIVGKMRNAQITGANAKKLEEQVDRAVRQVKKLSGN